MIFEDNRYMFEATMIVGSVEIRCTSNGDGLADATAGRDKIQPETVVHIEDISTPTIS